MDWLQGKKFSPPGSLHETPKMLRWCGAPSTSLWHLHCFLQGLTMASTLPQAPPVLRIWGCSMMFQRESDPPKNTEVLTTFRPEIIETADRFYRVCAATRTADIWEGKEISDDFHWFPKDFVIFASLILSRSLQCDGAIRWAKERLPNHPSALSCFVAEAGEWAQLWRAPERYQKNRVSRIECVRGLRLEASRAWCDLWSVLGMRSSNLTWSETMAYNGSHWKHLKTIKETESSFCLAWCFFQPWLNTSHNNG